MSDSIEVHMVELSKYSLQEASICQASLIEQRSFFLLFADRYAADRLHKLLLGDAFQWAIGVLKSTDQKTGDRMMYDDQEQALRDDQWAFASARAEGSAEGSRKG